MDLYAPPRINPGSAVQIEAAAYIGRPLTISHGDRQLFREVVPPTGRVTWQAPNTDGAGYLVQVGNAVLGLDVSSSPWLYPRYGYVSEFDSVDAAATMRALAEYRLNVIQFYDWHWRHEIPVAPTEDWLDLAGRTIKGSVGRALIREAKARRMTPMAYNLIYGAFDDAKLDPDWALYEDADATRPWAHGLPSGWQTPRLRILNPGSTGWRDQIFRGMEEAMTRFGFEGWHADQLGDPGPRFTRKGEPVQIGETFGPFLAAAQQRVPGALVFNNVGGFGLEATQQSPVDSLYLEAWDWITPDLNALSRLVTTARTRAKQITLAGYLQSRYQEKFRREKPGEFNRASFLTTEATVMASGGWKLSLGDQLNALCHEYFPNKNLVMSRTLRAEMRRYAQFGVAYQEWLRGPEVMPTALPFRHPLIADQAIPGKVWAISRKSGPETIVHLINLTGRNDLSWRDLDATAPETPRVPPLQVAVLRGTKVFVASPDHRLRLTEIPVRQGEVTLPALQNWTMVVLRPTPQP